MKNIDEFMNQSRNANKETRRGAALFCFIAINCFDHVGYVHAQGRGSSARCVPQPHGALLTRNMNVAANCKDCKEHSVMRLILFKPALPQA